MKESRVGFIAFSMLAAGLCIAFLIRYSSFSSPSRSAPLTSSNSEIAQEQAPSIVSSHIDSLVESEKIDRRVVARTTGNAFSIARQEHRPKGDALTYIEPLLTQSNEGNAVATYAIYLAVNQCKSTLVAPSDELLEKYKKSGTNDVYLEDLDRNLDECESLTADAQLMNKSWLEKAAEQGSIEARIMYAIDSDSIIGLPSEYLSHPEKLVQYRASAISYLNSAANTGSVDALMLLGRAYEAGVLTEKSPVKAYAYYKAVEGITASSEMQGILGKYRANLSATEVAEANQLSSTILRSCCN